VELLNTFAVSHRDNPVLAVFLTVLAGFVPYAGVVIPLLVALRYARRNRANRGLCILLLVIALVFTLLWVAFFVWQGGSGSLDHSHSTKVH